MKEESPKTVLVGLEEMRDVCSVLKNAEAKGLGKFYSFKTYETQSATDAYNMFICAWSDFHYEWVRSRKSRNSYLNIGVLWTSVAQAEMSDGQVEPGQIEQIKKLPETNKLKWVWLGSPDWMELFQKYARELYTRLIQFP